MSYSGWRAFQFFANPFHWEKDRGTYALAQWVARRRLRALVYLAAASSLLVLTNLEGAVWLALAVVLVTADILLFGGSPAKKEASLILALFPMLYAIGVWMLLNWLIMGDALYFVRSLLRSGWRGPPAGWARLELTLPEFAAGGLGILALALGALLRDRAAAALGLLAVGAPGVALFLVDRDLLWGPVPLLLCLLPLACMAVGRAAGSMPRAAAAVLCALPLGLTAATLAVPSLSAPRLGPRNDYGLAVTERALVLDPVRQYVLRQSPFAKVFVCGYDGLRVLGGRPDPEFLHSLDFSFGKAMTDYYGCPLYLLVHRPEGRSGMESIHWKFPGIFDAGARNTLIVLGGDHGNWRLFEIVLPEK
jgi:hypothetical protein